MVFRDHGFVGGTPAQVRFERGGGPTSFTVEVNSLAQYGLPSSVPEINALHIDAAYCPMTAVAGDFYEFIPVDQNRVGVLVADVSGHGGPAAHYRGDDQSGDAVGGLLRPRAA